MDEIIALDKYIFSLINGTWHNPLFDLLLPLARNKLIWLPFYVFLFSYMTINFKVKGLIFILALVLSVSIADMTSSRLIKQNVERIRPCNDPAMTNEVRTLVNCGSGYSFTSSHASNHFAVACFLIFTLGAKWKWIKIPLLIWAFVIAYSQVYVGVHYPFDVIAGGLLGAIIGTVISFLYRVSSWGKEFYKEVKPGS